MSLCVGSYTFTACSKAKPHGRTKQTVVGVKAQIPNKGIQPPKLKKHRKFLAIYLKHIDTAYFLDNFTYGFSIAPSVRRKSQMLHLE